MKKWLPSVAQQHTHNELDVFAIIVVDIRAQLLLKRCGKVRETARKHSAAGELEEGISGNEPRPYCIDGMIGYRRKALVQRVEVVRNGFVRFFVVAFRRKF